MRPKTSVCSQIGKGPAVEREYVSLLPAPSVTLLCAPFVVRPSAVKTRLCRFQLTGVLDDCFCDVESIDVFNNFKIYPRIKKLTEKDYFRYYKVRARCDPPRHE